MDGDAGMVDAWRAAGEPAAGPMATILLVEDDIDVRVLVEHVLLSARCDVTAVETVRSAKRLLDGHAYDLVVADGNLPDGTGLDVADYARELGIGTLIVTGVARRLPQRRLNQYPHLLKPVRPAKLLDAISALLPKKEGEAEILPFLKSP